MDSRSARVLLAAVLSVLALAATASTASAQSVELLDEATAEHCPSVSLEEGTPVGGCPIHLVDDQAVTFAFHWMGIENYEFCHLEIVGRFDEVGGGYVEQFDLSSGGRGACGFGHCPMYRPLPWAAQVSESGSAKLTFQFCYDEDLFNVVYYCPFELTLSEIASHSYQADVVGTGCFATNGSVTIAFPVEVESGRLIGESPSEEFPSLEVAHL